MQMNDAMQRPDRVRRRASYLLNQAAGAAARLVTEHLGAAGVRRPHYSLLAALQEFGAASQASLGRRCGIDRSDIVGIINDLEGRGLVRRSQDPNDRRRNSVSITQAGIAYLTHLDSVMEEIQDDLLGPLTDDEAATLVALLAQIVEHHSDREGDWTQD